ncbi:MAG: hypothetical protein ACFN39_08860, partial [Lacticaseibacillus rhamnosus]
VSDLLVLASAHRLVLFCYTQHTNTNGRLQLFLLFHLKKLSLGTTKYLFASILRPLTLFICVWTALPNARTKHAWLGNSMVLSGFL